MTPFPWKRACGFLQLNSVLYGMYMYIMSVPSACVCHETSHLTLAAQWSLQHAIAPYRLKTCYSYRYTYRIWHKRSLIMLTMASYFSFFVSCTCICKSWFSKLHKNGILHYPEVWCRNKVSKYLLAKKEFMMSVSCPPTFKQNQWDLTLAAE